MNLSRSIFTVPPIFNSKDDSKSSSRRPSKRSRSSSTHPQSTTTNALSRPQGPKAARRSSDHLSIPSSCSLAGGTPALSDELSLLSPDHVKATTSKEPLGLAVRGQPPPKRLCSPTQPRRSPPMSAAESRENLELLEPRGLSDKAKLRPSLPLRLSSSEATPAMLGKANKEEAAKLKPLRIARGSPNSTVSSSAGRPRPTRTVSGNGFPGSPSRLKTPDGEMKSASLRLLDQIGVAELLDQDDRPTFMIDLGNQSTLDPGPLKIVFANVSLRTSLGLLEMVKGNTDLSSPGLSATTAFNEFKHWATSYVKNHEALDVNVPAFPYAGFTWSCSNLRKRIRLIRGIPNAGATSYGRNSPALSQAATSSMDIEGGLGLGSRMNHLAPDEPTDYFGSARAPNTPELPLTERGHGMFEASKAIPRSPRSNVSRSNPTEYHDHRTLSVRGSARSALLQDDHVLVSRADQPEVRLAGMERLVQKDTFAYQDQGSFDWTRLPGSTALPPHIQFAMSVDWASTALGPMETWSSELRSMCNLIMASPHPAAMYWGEELTAIYNEAYILLAGEKHPSLMGQSYRVAWAEIWDLVKDVFAVAVSTGQATMKDDDRLLIRRSPVAGLLEETYFHWSIIPLIGPNGTVVGLYNPAFEKTRRKIAERRMLTLREVGEKTAAAPELKSFWRQVLKALDSNEEDTPFVLAYSLSDDIESDASSIQSNGTPNIKQCILEGTLGVPVGHSAAPSCIDLQGDIGFFAQIFRDAMKSDRPVLLRTEDGTLDASTIEGMEWRGFGAPCTAVVVCPINLATSNSTLGFLVLGINPRRPYDDDYSLFVQLLSRQLTTSMASVVLFEEEIARGRRAARLAALERIELSEQLEARTQEKVESETKFTRMAELAPVGIFIADKTGRITYCNDMWYEVSKIQKESQAYDKWMQSVKDDDREKVNTFWYDLVHDAVPFTTEIRFKAPWQDPLDNDAERWVLLSAHPEKNEDGSVKVIFGSITDISKQKWAELLEKRRVDEAVEMKRLQDNFIDITSHEMRNPLSAILQCADEIESSLKDYEPVEDDSYQSLAKLLDSAIDSAQTIALCASHQKRIVDDILTLSKLDSALLLITPCDVMPVNVAQRALKMFDGEVQTADIQLQLRIDPSMQKLQVEWIRLDPSRLLQVLINLVTNSIKFTTGKEKRKIVVTVGASLDRPGKEGLDNVSFFPTRSKRQDLTESEEWGTGENVYIHFAVKDTGRGLDKEETKRLFMRFSQASPRTHVQYGGSGLGLFISRELVELQGGEIGVFSEAGVGSTFAFYVKARRTTAPPGGAETFHTPATRKQSAGGGQFPTALRLASKTNSTPAPIISANALKILLVEDNLINQKVLRKQLTNLGCVVHVANHGQECIDLLKKSTYWANHSPDAFDLTVVLMDLEMPVMDGLTCATTIRKLQEKHQIIKHVPIIAVTANARDKQMETALRSGMDDIVSKPFRIPELLPKIEELSLKFNTHPSTMSTAHSSLSGQSDH